MSKISEALLRAADWLEANPDRHIAGILAADKNGNSCGVGVKDAECFCALGRIGREMGWKGVVQPYSLISNYTSWAPWELNDKPTEKRPLVCNRRNPGNQAVIGVMRNLAERLGPNDPS